MLILHHLFDETGGDLRQRLTQVLESLPVDALPLIECTTQGGYIDAQSMGVSVLKMTPLEHDWQATVGVFFTEVVGGCNCADEPYRVNGYGEFILTIHRQTAETTCQVRKDSTDADYDL